MKFKTLTFQFVTTDQAYPPPNENHLSSHESCVKKESTPKKNRYFDEGDDLVFNGSQSAATAKPTSSPDQKATAERANASSNGQGKGGIFGGWLEKIIPSGGKNAMILPDDKHPEVGNSNINW